MKRRLRSLAVLVVIATVAGPVLAAGNANFLIGGRALDEDQWEPVDQHGVFGVTVDFGGADWPVHIEAGFYASADEETVFDDTLLLEADLTAAVAEFCFGVNKTFEPGEKIRPFIGGGLASVAADAELDSEILGSVDDDDSSLAAYVHGGVFWRLGKRFNIGLDGRIVTGTDLTLFEEDIDADYVQLGLVLGFGWPASQ